MTLQSELLEIGKSKLTQMKTLLDEMEVQFVLGKAEAKEVLERERKNFVKYVGEQKDQFRMANEKTESHRNSLREKLEALEAQLSKGFSSNKKLFEPAKKATLHAIYELESTAKAATGEVGIGLQARLGLFKNKLDDYRVKLALLEFENAADLVAPQEDLKTAVADLLEALKKEASTGEKIDVFAHEMSASFDHMKKAFSELLS
ncbi:MAG: hypothetical protein AAB316_24465 [Bacteroidota bacterium]